MRWIKKGKRIGILLCLLFFKVISANAQVSLDIEATDLLANSQAVNIQSLIATDGSAPVLFRLFLGNNDPNSAAKELYLEISLSSDQVGKILQITQTNDRSFSLNPGQQIYATNNSIINGVPGIRENIRFEGVLTPEGEDFIGDLQSDLPPDRYVIEVKIYQGRNRQNLIASAMTEVGTKLIADTQNLYLIAPGDVVGSGASIAGRYPNFQWQGTTGAKYRLIVVEERENESPQSLMEGAADTSPIQGIAAGGSLIDYEMLDAVVDGTSFQYPSAGVQELEPGKTYYWRVMAQFRTSTGITSKPSEIWSFSLPEKGTVGGGLADGEFSQALRIVLGDEKYKQVMQRGYSLQSVEVAGKTFRGGQALQKLLELSRQTEQGDVSILIEEQ